MSKAPSVHCKAISTNSGKQCKRNATLMARSVAIPAAVRSM
jgi:hypothetical protein